MKLFEKIQLMIGFIILVGYPLVFLIIGGQFIFLLISIIEIFVFFSFLIIKRCGNCLNFSCPFNRINKELVGAFLNRNPLIRRTWEEAGYKIKEG
ncbi:MAG: hypothetical protein ACFFG0_09425 [Candidatus Thorarchaeota archaeon]